MIVCKNCGYEMRGANDVCPRCKKRTELSAAEQEELSRAFTEAMRSRDYERAVSYCKLLANSGRVDFEREYAVMLEKGELVPRSYDEAMSYFLRAAKKHDAYSAYRYSRLVSRMNSEAGNFWLLYSAVIGCPDAYPAAAKQLSAEGAEREATHFYVLSAKHDDVDSIIELASRYYKGIGVAQSSEHAKWYMDMLSIPPLYAIKLSYRLRGLRGVEPPNDDVSMEPLVRRLSLEARRRGYLEPYYKLTAMLAGYGDVNAMTVLGTLLADGEGCTASLPEALRVLTEAATLGSADAYMCLAGIFLTGAYTEKDAPLAARYLEAAGKLGIPEGYAKLASLYEAGDVTGERDYKKAEEYYRKATDGGLASAAEKVNEIRAERERFFASGLANEGAAPKKAFRSYAIAAAMGHAAAPMKLAECYLKGVGTEVDRRAAFFWYKSAAEVGDDNALYPLGLCYFHGIGTARNMKAARGTLTKAARLGSSGARVALRQLNEARLRSLAASLYSRGMRLLFKKKFFEAKRALELSAELRHAKACYTLGCFHEFGLGTASDRARASAFYDEAFRLGFRDDGSRYKKTILRMIKQ